MAEVGSYLYLAKKDYNDAKLLLSGSSFSSCGRFCQQTIEKSFKHYIHLNGDINDQKSLHTHKIKRLYDKCKALGMKFALSAEEIVVLRDVEDCYFDTNYPGDDFYELDKEQAKAALKLAKKILYGVPMSMSVQYGGEK